MATPPHASADSPTSAAPPGSPRRSTQRGGGILARGWIVRLVIAVTLALTLGMVSLIYYRWLTVEEPTATVVIIGDSSLAGAQIILNPSPAGHVLPELDESDNYSTPIHLQPGNYHLTVRLQDQTIFEGSFPANRLTTGQVPLPTLLSVTGDPTQDGADLLLTGPDGRRLDTEELDSQDGYAATWRVYPGMYHLTALRNGITLYDQNVPIALHQPVTIALPQSRHG